MRAFPSGLLSLAFLAAPLQSAPDDVRRINYPQENFSIAIPAEWSEIEPSVLAAMPAAIRQAVPNVPEIKINHGFRASGTPAPSYPWVAIIITAQPLDEGMFEQMGWAKRTVDELIKKWESAGGILERAQTSNMSYDKDRHLLWSISQSTFAGIGDLRTLSGGHVTTTGTVQVHCYSKAADFARYQPVFKEIIESVVIDPKIKIAASPAKSPLLDGLVGTDYRTLVRRVELGDFSVDFRALRLACMQSTECQPRATKADLNAMNQALREQQFAKAVEIIGRLIRQGFVNLEAHANAAAAYRDLHDAAKSKFHLDVTTKLLRSILFSGDGATKQTAFEVISDREEISTLAAKGLPYAGSGVSVSSLEENGHHYDRWEIWDPKAEKTVVVFFKTDAFTAKSRVAAN